MAVYLWLYMCGFDNNTDYARVARLFVITIAIIITFSRHSSNDTTPHHTTPMAFGLHNTLILTKFSALGHLKGRKFGQN